MEEMYAKLDKLLQSHGLTAYRLSKELGFSVSVFPDWKKGRYVPKQDKIQKIADYFNVPISYFYGEEEKPSYYYDEETLQIAQDLHDDPEFRALFSADRKVRKEEIETVKKILKIMKGDNE